MDEVIAKLNGMEVNGRCISVRLCDDPLSEGCEIFVTGVSKRLVDEQVLDQFQQVGPILNTTLVKQRKRGAFSACFALEYSSVEAAQWAVWKFHGSEMDGGIINVSWRRK